MVAKSKSAPYVSPYYEKEKLREEVLFMKVRNGVMSPSEFNTLSHREKWSLSKHMKNVIWCCGNCGLPQGKTPPAAPFTGGSTHCSECDYMLTRRTGGGQNNPFNCTFKHL
jgi:hypothetical protein